MVLANFDGWFQLQKQDAGFRGFIQPFQKQETSFDYSANIAIRAGTRFWKNLYNCSYSRSKDLEISVGLLGSLGLGDCFYLEMDEKGGLAVCFGGVTCFGSWWRVEKKLIGRHSKQVELVYGCFLPPFLGGGETTMRRRTQIIQQKLSWQGYAEAANHEICDLVGLRWSI